MSKEVLNDDGIIIKKKGHALRNIFIFLLFMVALGNPARMVCSTEKVTDNVTGEKVYPWQYTFDRGMPWRNIGYDEWKKEQWKNEHNAKQTGPRISEISG